MGGGWPFVTLLAQAMTGPRIALAFLPTLVILGAPAIVSIAAGNVSGNAPALDAGVLKGLIIAAVCQMCLFYRNPVSARTRRRRPLERVMLALGATALILTALSVPDVALVSGTGSFATLMLQAIVLVVTWRLAIQWAIKRVTPFERLLLVGTGPAAIRLARELLDRREELRVEIVGFVDPDAARKGAAVLNPGVIGAVEEIPSIVRARSIDRVAVSVADARGKLPMERLLDMKVAGIGFEHLASIYEEYTGKIAVEDLRPSRLIFSTGFEATRWLAAKRAIDVIAACVTAVVLLPVILLVAVAVHITSRGPILYRQQRVGRGGHLFTILKFRSMRTDAEAVTGAVWARRNDDRVTPVGRFLRRWRLDELPQLWNVLTGDMSFVGPRPERPEFVKELERQIPYYAKRHVIRPGLTGWAQVRYTYGRTTDAAVRKLQYDLYYVKNMSVAMDVFIMAHTLKTLVLHAGD